MRIGFLILFLFNRFATEKKVERFVRTHKFCSLNGGCKGMSLFSLADFFSLNVLKRLSRKVGANIINMPMAATEKIIMRIQRISWKNPLLLRFLINRSVFDEACGASVPCRFPMYYL